VCTRQRAKGFESEWGGGKGQKEEEVSQYRREVRTKLDVLSGSVTCLRKRDSKRKRSSIRALVRTRKQSQLTRTNEKRPSREVRAQKLDTNVRKKGIQLEGEEMKEEARCNVQRALRR